MSASTSVTQFRAFEAAEVIPSGTYIKVDANGKIALPTGTDRVVGSVEYPATSDDVTAARAITVRLFGPTRVVRTAVLVTAGNLVYLASGGTVSTTGTILAGAALEGGVATDFVEIADVQ